METVRQVVWYTVFIFVTFLVIGFLSSCGTEEATLGAPEEVVSEPAPTEPTDPSPTPTEPTASPSPTNTTSGGGGGGGGSSPQPTPECVENSQCGAGFECVSEHCVALPECREDIPCANPNTFCAENNTCQPKPCTQDSECVESAYCLPDRTFTGEGDAPTVCREKSCPVVGETIDPNSVVVHETCGETEEEQQAEYDFTVGQLQLVYPDLSILSEAIKICELEEPLAVLQERFDNLDAVRIQLDDHLASCNLGE